MTIHFLNADGSPKTIEFDEENLHETADVVCMLNPHAAAYGGVDALVDHMKNAAETTNWSRYGYVSTLGYVLSAYHIDKNTLGIKASVSAYTVKTFLQRNKQKEAV